MTESPKDFETVALVVDEPGKDFKLQEIILDEVRDDEFLIEMKYTGICHTVSVVELIESDFLIVPGYRAAARSSAYGRLPCHLWS